MDKSLESSQNVPCKVVVAKRRRGRPPKYPDVWGKPCPDEITDGDKQPMIVPEKSLSDKPVNQSVPRILDHKIYHRKSPELEDSIDHSTSHSDNSDNSDVQYMGFNKGNNPQTSISKQCQTSGSLTETAPVSGCGHMQSNQSAMVVTEEELMRMYYEAGGRDVKNFPNWVQRTYQGRAHPIKFARVQSKDDPAALSKPTVVIVETEDQMSNHSSLIMRPLNISPSSMQLQQCQRPIQQPLFQSKKSHPSFPLQRTCDTDVSTIVPPIPKCGVVKPNCLNKSDDVALDLSLSTPRLRTSTDIQSISKSQLATECKNVELWTVDEVCKFVSEVANCEAYAQVFKEHVIDGQLLLELSENQMITHLQMKLGPAMHLRRAIDKLKSAQ